MKNEMSAMYKKAVVFSTLETIAGRFLISFVIFIPFWTILQIAALAAGLSLILIGIIDQLKVVLVECIVLLKNR
ncbi:MAG: hypothetical protein PHO56_01815 [Patescibacteria group bacterium]|nr:hypothetical protein [Patescibacteria group bacterium]